MCTKFLPFRSLCDFVKFRFLAAYFAHLDCFTHVKYLKPTRLEVYFYFSQFLKNAHGYYLFSFYFVSKCTDMLARQNKIFFYFLFTICLGSLIYTTPHFLIILISKYLIQFYVSCFVQFKKAYHFCNTSITNNFRSVFYYFDYNKFQSC